MRVSRLSSLIPGHRVPVFQHAARLPQPRRERLSVRRRRRRRHRRGYRHRSLGLGLMSLSEESLHALTLEPLKPRSYYIDRYIVCRCCAHIHPEAAMSYYHLAPPVTLDHQLRARADRTDRTQKQACRQPGSSLRREVVSHTTCSRIIQTINVDPHSQYILICGLQQCATNSSEGIGDGRPVLATPRSGRDVYEARLACNRVSRRMATRCYCHPGSSRAPPSPLSFDLAAGLGLGCFGPWLRLWLRLWLRGL
jgi:hypothetical protein